MPGSHMAKVATINLKEGCLSRKVVARSDSRKTLKKEYKSGFHWLNLISRSIETTLLRYGCYIPCIVGFPSHGHAEGIGSAKARHECGLESAQNFKKKE